MARNKKRADGRYQVRVSLGKGPDGKTKYKSFFGSTYAEAERKKADYLAAGAAASGELRTYADRWLRHKKTAPDVSEGQYISLKAKADYWVTALSGSRIDEIDLDALQSIVDSLAAKNPATGRRSAQNTVKKYIEVIRAIYSYCGLSPDPTPRLKNTAVEAQNDRRALDPDERRRIVEFRHRAQLPAMLMMFAGLRRGEVTALRWSDIDLKNGEITVNKSYDFKTGETKSTKTAAGVRVIPVSSTLGAFLKDWMRENKPDRSGYVVLSARGGLMTEPAWRRLLDSYLTDLDAEYGGRRKMAPANRMHVYTIEPFTWHCLRHTFATLLYESGVDVKAAQYLMGHADIATTMAIYTHLSEAHKKSEFAKIELKI